MQLNRVGFVGWRGMVGSVLLQRMRQEADFALIQQPVFFTTSQIGKTGPDIGRDIPLLVDAMNLDELQKLDVLVSCQGDDYTRQVYSRLRARGWNGYWIDAAKTLRMEKSATLILDPVNMPVIQKALKGGCKDFIGANCTVSLMMMALDGLFKADLVEWVTVMTYQAISGGGAQQMRELIQQMGVIHANAHPLLSEANSMILDIDSNVANSMRSDSLPRNEIGHTLAGSLLPWIDKDLDSGISLEEHKGSTEVNKILDKENAPIPIESTCIRIGTMRCHSQAFTIKLTQAVPQDEIMDILNNANNWVQLVKNSKEDALAQLTPTAVTGTLNVPIGRVRKLRMGDNYLSAFTVGDQLLWGAAEPLRRMLRILFEYE